MTGGSFQEFIESVREQEAEKRRIEEQKQRCLIGHHEEDTVEKWREFPARIGVCKHCRAIYVQREG